mmetsp:Transcript_3238/g.7166  ORF Transcript_3238/g.7166 Transcript_3238/m.7166 type:complete len:250 (+) Transcript_3238:1858-2607(+)
MRGGDGQQNILRGLRADMPREAGVFPHIFLWGRSVIVCRHLNKDGGKEQQVLLVHLYGGIGVGPSGNALPYPLEGFGDGFVQIGVSCTAVHDDPLSGIHRVQIDVDSLGRLMRPIRLGALPPFISNKHVLDKDGEPSALGDIAGVHHGSEVLPAVDPAQGQHPRDDSLLAHVQLPPKTHAEHIVLQFALIVHRPGQRRGMGAHPHDPIGQLRNEQSRLLRLTPEHEIRLALQSNARKVVLSSGSKYLSV